MDDCPEHPGAWCGSCATCEQVRAAHIAVHGEWSLGDTGVPSLSLDFLQFLADVGIGKPLALLVFEAYPL